MGNDEKYKAMYKQAIDAIKKHLIFQPMTIDEQDILFTGSVNASKPVAELITLRPQVEHLAVFSRGYVRTQQKSVQHTWRHCPSRKVNQWLCLSISEYHNWHYAWNISHHTLLQHHILSLRSWSVVEGHTECATPGICESQRQKIPSSMSTVCMETEYVLTHSMLLSDQKWLNQCSSCTEPPVTLCGRKKNGSCSTQSENTRNELCSLGYKWGDSHWAIIFEWDEELLNRWNVEVFLAAL